MESSNSYYFPAASLAPKNERFDEDLFRRRWYSNHLRAMAEPSLSGEDGGEAHRLLWLRSFHAPIAVRATATSEGAQVVTVKLNGMGGYDPADVAERTQRRLASDEWAQITAAFTAADFWKVASWQKVNALDGAQWIVEARSTMGYHVVDRWSPQSGPVRELGIRLLNLGRVDLSSNVY